MSSSSSRRAAVRAASLNGQVKSPLPKVLPDGYELASEFNSIGSVATDGSPKPAAKAAVKGKSLKIGLNCASVNLCRGVTIEIKGTQKPLKGVTIAKKTIGVKLNGGKSVSTSLNLTAKARKAFRDTKKRVRTGRPGKTKFKNIVLKGLKKTGAKVTVRGWDPPRSTNLTITRTGRVN